MIDKYLRILSSTFSGNRAIAATSHAQTTTGAFLGYRKPTRKGP